MSNLRTIDPELLFSHTQWMRRLARRLVTDAEGADDLVQDAWQAALSNPPRKGVPLRAWLAGILKKRALHVTRTSGRRTAREASVARPDHAPSTDELAACADEQQFLIAEVLKLPAPQRDVLLLRFYEDLSPRDIAERLGSPINTVRTQLQRGLLQLREALDRRHAGDRSAWGLALLPLAAPGRGLAVAATAAATTATTTSVLGWKPAIAAIALALAGVTAWQVTLARRPLDLTQSSSAEDASAQLIGRATSNATAIAPVASPDTRIALAAPARAAQTPAETQPTRSTTLVLDVFDSESGRRVPRFLAEVSPISSNGQQGARYSELFTSEETLDGQWRHDVTFAPGQPTEVWLFRVPGMPLGKVATKQPIEFVADGVTRVRIELDLQAHENSGAYDLATGTILDAATGEPVAGAQIHGSWSGGTDILLKSPVAFRGVVSYGDGRFRLALPHGPTFRGIWVEHPHYLGSVQEQPSPKQIVVRLQRRGALHGTLLDVDRQPLAGAPLLLIATTLIQQPSRRRIEAMFSERATTDDNGRFEFSHLREGRYTLCVMRGAKQPDEAAILRRTVRLGAGEQRDLIVEMSPPDVVLVRGTVTPRTPVDHALVPAFLPYAEEGRWAQAESISSGYRAGALTRGRYLVLLLPATDDHSEGPFALLPDIEVDGFGETRLDFRYPTNRLTGRVAITGKITDLWIAAVPNVPSGFAQDFVLGEKIAQLFARPVAADGTFVIDGVADGPHRLRLFRGRRNATEIATLEVDVAGSQTLSDWRVSDAR